MAWNKIEETSTRHYRLGYRSRIRRVADGTWNIDGARAKPGHGHSPDSMKETRIGYERNRGCARTGLGCSANVVGKEHWRDTERLQTEPSGARTRTDGPWSKHGRSTGGPRGQGRRHGRTTDDPRVKCAWGSDGTRLCRDDGCGLRSDVSLIRGRGSV